MCLLFDITKRRQFKVLRDFLDTLYNRKRRVSGGSRASKKKKENMKRKWKRIYWRGRRIEARREERKEKWNWKKEEDEELQEEDKKRGSWGSVISNARGQHCNYFTVTVRCTSEDGTKEINGKGEANKGWERESAQEELDWRDWRGEGEWDKDCISKRADELAGRDEGSEEGFWISWRNRKKKKRGKWELKPGTVKLKMPGQKCAQAQCNINKWE